MKRIESTANTITTLKLSQNSARLITRFVVQKPKIIKLTKIKIF